MNRYPLDWKMFPHNRKYFIEEDSFLGEWIIFGKRADGSGVDVHNTWFGDIFVGVPENKAQELIKARDVFCREIERICNARQS